MNTSPDMEAISCHFIKIIRKYNRLIRLKQAAELFLLQIIEMGSWVGIVTFNSAATIKTNLKEIVNDTVRQQLVGYLPITASGGTNICAGVLAGFQVFLQKYTSTGGCEIVLLTDGEDTTIRTCFPQVQSSGSIIHTIALGPDAAKELEKLAEMTGGLTFSATDSLDANGLIDAFSGLSSGSGIISQQSIQLESKAESVGPVKWFDGTISIDKTVGNDTFFLVTWSAGASPPGIFLTDPTGKKYNKADFVIDNTNVRTARLKIPGTAEAGDWVYSILNTYSAAQVISITVTTRAASANVPPVTVKAYMNSKSNNYPNPVVIYAEVSQGFLPVVGASVTATVESVSGTSVDIELFDNGSGADIVKHDGIYSRYFTSFQENGRYSIKVRVKGIDKTARRTRRQSQAMYVPGFVDEDGEIKLNPPRPIPPEEETYANIENVSRTISGGSFDVTGVLSGNHTDVFPPNKITDLEVELTDDDGFLLSWTAPGNDYDSGKAARYEIKTSEDPLELRDANFNTATALNTTGLVPEEAGTNQSFLYKPETFPKENVPFIYFAIRAIDDSNNIGEVSNIARASLFHLLPIAPTTPPGTYASSSSQTNTPENKHSTSFTVKTIYTIAPNNKENDSPLNIITTIVLIVCVAAIIISLIISITICVLCWQRNRRPGTEI